MVQCRPVKYMKFEHIIIFVHERQQKDHLLIMLFSVFLSECFLSTSITKKNEKLNLCLFCCFSELEIRLTLLPLGRRTEDRKLGFEIDL